jgi:hypothetical protein
MPRARAICSSKTFAVIARVARGLGRPDTQNCRHKVERDNVNDDRESLAAPRCRQTLRPSVYTFHSTSAALRALIRPNANAIPFCPAGRE